MAENKVDVSAMAFELAKTAGITDEGKFKTFETELVKKIYEIIGLAEIPEEFLTFTKFVDAYAGVLMKSVQNDIAIMNLTKRLSMFKLSETIAQSGELDKKPETPEQKQETGDTGFDPLAADKK